MAVEASRATNSTGTVKSRCLLRRNSLPLFRSDLGKDVPGYLRTSTSSCHDYCKHGRKETAEVKQTQPGIKRPVTVPGLKASDKPRSRQDEPVKVRKPWVLPDKKTPEASSKQNVPREKDTKASEGAPKSVKSKLLRDNFMTRKSAPTSGHEKIEIQKVIVPESGASRDAKINIKGIEGAKLTKPVKGPSTNATVKQKTKAKPPSPSSSPVALKMATRLKRLSSISPHRVRPMTKARPQSSATPLEIAKRLKPPSSTSPHRVRPMTKARPQSSATPLEIAKRLKPPSSTSPHRVRPMIKARPQSSATPLKMATRRKPLSSSSPERVRPVTKARPQYSPTRLKPVSLSANSSFSPGSLKLKLAVKTSPPSTPPRRVSNKKTLTISSQIGKKGKSSQVQATEAVANRRGFVSPDSVVAVNSDKSELQQENLGEPEIAEKKELFEKIKGNSSHETLEAIQAVATRCDSVAPDSEVAESYDMRELQHENLVEAEIAEEEEEHLSHETDLQNQEFTESYDDEVPEKTLYVVKMETGNENQPALNPEEDIDDMQPLASLNPPQSPSSPNKNQSAENAKEEIADMQPLASLSPPLSPPNENQPAANAEEEIADMQPLASLSLQLSPSSPISVTVSYMATQTDSSLNELGNTDTAVPCTDQETPDMQSLPSLSPAISPKSLSSITASNDLSHYEVSMDDSMYSETDSSYENELLSDGEDLRGGADNIKVKRVSRVTSQDNEKDPVKLQFRRGRVIEIAQENHGPRRLKFRRVKVRDEQAAKDFVRKSSFKIAEPTQVNATTDNSAGTVVLRHQDTQDKKDAQGLLNNVIEETASKLVEKRKSMVKALVGAFETVILLQDGKPATTQDD